MRILYICGDQGIPVFGRKGASTHMREMIAAFRRQGHEVCLASPDLSGDRREEEEFPLIELPAPKSRLLGKDGRYLYANIAARKVLLKAARDFKATVIYERSALYFLAGQWLMEQTGLPRILEVNTLLSRELAHRLHYPSVAEKFERKLILKAPAIASISNFMAQELETEIGRPLNTTRAFSMAVDPERFKPTDDGGERRRQLGWSDKEIVLGFVGSMNEYHKPHWFTDLAEKKLRRGETNLRFVIVGGSTKKIERERNRLLKWVDEGLVHYTGSVPQGKMGGWLSMMDAVLVPGASPQSTPTKIFEAAAVGTPLLLPATEPIKELCGEDAPYLFQPEDFPAFEGKVREFCENPGKFVEPARKLHEKVVKECTWDNHAQGIIEWFRELGAKD
ncbi:MAG: glycosyltransferase family 4 protein [Candidatus Sumerlaeia bacterium]|nr:glycosyltransferase family 4 protein [Candidatus Sumerlaeia bacterium]